MAFTAFLVVAVLGIVFASPIYKSPFNANSFDLSKAVSRNFHICNAQTAHKITELSVSVKRS
jgi:hypothetical protein